MARPFKDGLEYFPLNTDFEDDDKVAIIEAQYGNTGHSLLVRLLSRIYKNGYFYHWTEKEQLLLSKRINVNINDLSAMINDCVKWGFFDADLFQQFKILTSQGIQKRYLEATVRRQEVKVYKPYLLLSQIDLKKYRNVILVDENGKSERVYVNINSALSNVNGNINTQSKEKEKERKEKERESSMQMQDNAYFTQQIIKFWDENGFGFNNIFAKQKMLSWLDEPQLLESGNMILYALELASEANKRTINYVEGILKKWVQAGCTTLLEAQNSQKEFKQQFQKNKSKDVDWDSID